MIGKDLLSRTDIELALVELHELGEPHMPSTLMSTYIKKALILALEISDTGVVRPVEAYEVPAALALRQMILES